MAKRNAPVMHHNLPVLEVAEPATLDQLLADPATGQFLLGRLSDSIAVVAPEQFDTLIARLRKLGHLPKVEG